MGTEASQTGQCNMHVSRLPNKEALGEFKHRSNNGLSSPFQRLIWQRIRYMEAWNRVREKGEVMDLRHLGGRFNWLLLE